jgi:hypothetical protein
MEGSGKGRMELVNAKYTFDYESQLNKKTNHFNLALAFPVVGEKNISLSLDPKETAKEIHQSQVLQMIEEKIGERYNKKQIMNAMEEFFVLTSEFLYYRSKDKFPSVYTSRFENDHFYMQRTHGQFRFEVESFAEEGGFFKRVLVKIYPLDPASMAPLFTLFLVPETCDRR